MFESLDISASALLAQRTRMDAIAGNIANMNTTRNARGEAIPYRRRFAVFAAGRPVLVCKAVIKPLSDPNTSPAGLVKIWLPDTLTGMVFP